MKLNVSYHHNSSRRSKLADELSLGGAQTGGPDRQLHLSEFVGGKPALSSDTYYRRERVRMANQSPAAVTAWAACNFGGK
jgi:hypothetical protein